MNFGGSERSCATRPVFSPILGHTPLSQSPRYLQWLSVGNLFAAWHVLFLLDRGQKNEFHARRVSLTLSNNCLLNLQFL